MCTDFGPEFFDIITLIIYFYVDRIDKKCGYCVMGSCCGKSDDITVMAGKILCFRLFIQWIFGFEELITVISFVYSAHFNGSIFETYEAGGVSLGTVVFFFGDFAVLILIILIACQICLCRSQTKNVDSLFKRKIGFKLLMIFMDIFAFLFTLFLDLDVGESLLNTSYWLSILLFVFFVVDIIGLVVDIVEIYILMKAYNKKEKTKQKVSPNENADTENINVRNDTNDITRHDNQSRNTIGNQQHRYTNISQPINENHQQSNANTVNPSYANVHPFGCNNSNVDQRIMMGYMPPIVYHPQIQAGYSGFYGTAPPLNQNQQIRGGNTQNKTKVIFINGKSNEKNYI